MTEPGREYLYEALDYVAKARTQEVAERFRRVAVSWKIRELRVVLIPQEARAGMGM